jgi:hypothetical protein
VYSRSLKTGWKPPLKIRQLSEEQAQDLRDRFHIIVEGENLLSPIIDFKEMKMPPAILRQLAAKNISKPTPIQMQVCALLCQSPFRPLILFCFSLARQGRDLNLLQSAHLDQAQASRNLSQLSPLSATQYKVDKLDWHPAGVLAQGSSTGLQFRGLCMGYLHSRIVSGA